MIFFKRVQINRLVKKLNALHQERTLNQPLPDAVSKEVMLYHKLARIYESLHGNKQYPFAQDMAFAVYRACAALDDSEAAYQLGLLLVNKGKCIEDLQLSGLFASNSNERLMKELYAEGHAYLQAAEQLQHIEAKRFRGLCYINGWGVLADKKYGFDLIIASIDQENSWDKVPQLFAAMGLNKPEFYSALAAHRKS